ncbi:MAG: hypothetical protein KDJ22_00975 [Candidatus Competibacteraceae bacterium]|nr:hypothetical protein [Candidatus Competibacteraceae bacterium]MCP5126053.1 hypothetical protein [Gammaproteobacteria bacterium]HRX70281.1 hypothetical protein [Candidatus Competibacteraceae bacterium]
MKIRHILLALVAVLAIAFMQPLVFFVGGLTLLCGVGALIFRDLSPAGQDAMERRVLGWLRRARSNPMQDIEFPAVRRRSSSPVMSATGPSSPKPERIRRARPRTPILQNDPFPDIAEPLTHDETTPSANRYAEPRQQPDEAV